MKTETVKVNTFEVGDILDITDCDGMETYSKTKKEHFKAATRALIIGEDELLSGVISYTILTDFEKILKCKSHELTKAKYLGDVDLSLMTF